MSTDTKPTEPVAPATDPSVETSAAGKPPKAARSKTASAAKPASRTKTKPAVARPDAVKPAAPIAEAAPEPSETDGESRKKKEKKQKKKAKKKDKKSKEAVIIRFDDAQLPQIDASAEALGLSRAAWVRMVVAKALS